MTKVIVCTTINEPTEAISKYDQMDGWLLVVIGDKKTPIHYRLQNGLYLSPQDQEKLAPNLSELLGWNCIQRRNIGFLMARQLGAEVICTVDDDNIPLDEWGKELYVGREVSVTEYLIEEEAFDPIGATNYPILWHRGFPLELLSQRKYLHHRTSTIVPMVQADFWNGDPDIDAFCRMEHRPECNFDSSCFPFTSNKLSPFNSQNTFISRDVLSEYFLFPYVGRMDDIWASYYLQSLGHRVLYNRATVYQNRNEHNLIVDMKNEYLGYENNLKLIQALVESPLNIRKFLPEKAIAAWDEYRRLME